MAEHKQISTSFIYIAALQSNKLIISHTVHNSMKAHLLMIADFELVRVVCTYVYTSVRITKISTHQLNMPLRNNKLQLRKFIEYPQTIVLKCLAVSG